MSDFPKTWEIIAVVSGIALALWKLLEIIIWIVVHVRFV